MAREAKAVETALTELKSKVAEDTIAFVPTGEVVVAAGDKGGKDALAKLRKIATAETERISSELDQRASDEARLTEQKLADLQSSMDETLRAEREKLTDEAQDQKEELRRSRDEIEALKPLMTIGETEFRQLDEKSGPVRAPAGSSGPVWVPRPSATSSCAWTSTSCRGRSMPRSGPVPGSDARRRSSGSG